VVDDHSDDDTLKLILEMATRTTLIVAVSCSESESGKRDALRKGISKAETEIILTTDADCIVSPDWASVMLADFLENMKLVTGPVISVPEGLRSSFEYAEALFLVSIGAGSAKHGLLFQASGANMIFFKKDFAEFYKSAHGAEFKCGDDVFFLQHLQKKYGLKSTGFCNKAAAVVRTRPCGSIQIWIQQRVRWARKSRGYSGLLPFVFAGITTLSNAALMTAYICMCVFPELLFFIMPGIALKVMGDFLVLFAAASRWKIPMRMIPFFLMPLLYPLFLLWVAWMLFFGKKHHWKGRQIR